LHDFLCFNVVVVFGLSVLLFLYHNGKAILTNACAISLKDFWWRMFKQLYLFLLFSSWSK